jgi:hypothetical protein
MLYCYPVSSGSSNQGTHGSTVAASPPFHSVKSNNKLPGAAPKGTIKLSHPKPQKVEASSNRQSASKSTHHLLNIKNSTYIPKSKKHFFKNMSKSNEISRQFSLKISLNADQIATLKANDSRESTKNSVYPLSSRGDCHASSATSSTLLRLTPPANQTNPKHATLPFNSIKLQEAEEVESREGSSEGNTSIEAHDRTSEI